MIKYENELGDRMIKQLLNLVITKYCDFQCQRSIIWQSRRQIIDLLATEKSHYFAQPHPIIEHYLLLYFYYNKYLRLEH